MRGAALNDPTAGVLVCLIGADGSALLHRVPRLNDPEITEQEVRSICGSIDDKDAGADCAIALHAAATHRASGVGPRRRFQVRFLGRQWAPVGLSEPAASPGSAARACCVASLEGKHACLLQQAATPCPCLLTCLPACLPTSLPAPGPTAHPRLTHLCRRALLTRCPSAPPSSAPWLPCWWAQRRGGGSARRLMSLLAAPGTLTGGRLGAGGGWVGGWVGCHCPARPCCNHSCPIAAARLVLCCELELATGLPACLPACSHLAGLCGARRWARAATRRLPT